MTLPLPTETLRRLGQAWVDTHTYTIAEDLEYIRAFFGLDKVGDEMLTITQVRSAPSLSDLYRFGNDRRPRQAEHIALVATLLREFAELMRRETGESEPASRDAIHRWLHTGAVGTVEGPQTPLAVLSKTPTTVAALNDVRASLIGE